MSSKNLSTVTTELIASSGNAARNMINAYRVGNERVIGFMDQRWKSALAKSGAQLDAEVRGNALSAQQKLSTYYSKGLDLTTHGADAVVRKAVELAARGVQQLAANAGRFEQSTGVTTLHLLAQASVPAAQAIGKLAGQLEHRSGQWADRIAGKATAAKRVSPFKRARARKVV